MPLLPALNNYPPRSRHPEGSQSTTNLVLDLRGTSQEMSKKRYSSTESLSQEKRPVSTYLPNSKPEFFLAQMKLVISEVALIYRVILVCSKCSRKYNIDTICSTSCLGGFILQSRSPGKMFHISTPIIRATLCSLPRNWSGWLLGQGNTRRKPLPECTFLFSSAKLKKNFDELKNNSPGNFLKRRDLHYEMSRMLQGHFPFSTVEWFRLAKKAISANSSKRFRIVQIHHYMPHKSTGSFEIPKMIYKSGVSLLNAIKAEFMVNHWQRSGSGKVGRIITQSSVRFPGARSQGSPGWFGLCRTKVGECAVMELFCNYTVDLFPLDCTEKVTDSLIQVVRCWEICKNSWF